jgi:putative transposase
MGERSKERKRSRSSGRATKRRPRVQARRRPLQLDLARAYKGRGGPRPGAGRKRRPGRTRVPHRRRAAVRRDRPLHVTLRLLGGLPRLRGAAAFGRVRSAIASGHKADFRVVHFSVMTNHVHLIVEADDREALARGMKGLKTRVTRRLNRLWSRKGTIFAERYHAREITTPREARNVLLYVLGNARKHAAERGRRLPARWVDPCSSARQFDGWRQRVRLEPGVVAAARTWLLRMAWRRHGLLDAHAIPASAGR